MDTSPQQEAGEKCGLGFWIILDRGNHRLAYLNMKGESLFTVGTCFPPQLESRWAMNLTQLERPQPGEECQGTRPYDPLYYPMRLLGQSEDCLFVWEPLAREVKQIVHGNLLPVSLSGLQDATWLSVDEEGLLGWKEHSNRLIYYDAVDNQRYETEIHGTPVASNLPSSQVWLWANGELQLWGWGEKPPPARKSNGRSGLWLLFLKVEEKLGIQSKTEQLESLLRSISSASRDLSSLSEEICRLASGEKVSTSSLDYTGEQRSLVARQCTQWATELQSAFSGDPLTELELHLLQEAGNRCGSRCGESGVLRRRAQIAESIHKIFIDLHRSLDDIYLLRTGSLEGQAASPKRDLHTLLVQHENDLLAPLQQIQDCFRALKNGPLPPSPHTQSSGQAKQSAPGIQPGGLPRPDHSSSLREIDRLYVGNPNSQVASAPFSLTQSEDGTVFVALSGTRQIIRLDRCGRMTGTVVPGSNGDMAIQHPCGITTDNKNRLWISDLSNHVVTIWNPCSESLEAPQIDGDRSMTFRHPHGLCKTAEGSILVADTGNNRVVKIHESGRREVLCGGAGRGEGWFHHPIAACPDPCRENDFWIVDQRNHRIQKFDGRGDFLHEIGGCGLDRNQLLLPESVSAFPDGILAVTQARFNQALKLSSPTGEELDCTFLSYSPAGMLIHEGFLWVSEWSGNHIRVYERT